MTQNSSKKILTGENDRIILMYDRNCHSLPTFCQSNDDSRLDDNKTVNEIKIVIYNLNKHFIHIYVCVYIYIYIYIYIN